MPNAARKVPVSAKANLFRKLRTIPLTASIAASCSASVNLLRSLCRMLSAIFLIKIDQPVEVRHIAFKSYMLNALLQKTTLIP